MDLNKSYKYVDTHCHLDLYKDYRQVISESDRSNTLIIAVTNLPSIFEQECALFQEYSNVIVSLGLHPQLVGSHSNQINLMLKLIPKVQFIGEVGLDYQDNKEELEVKQRQIFKQILDKAAEYKNKIISVHSRNSADDVVSMIGANFPGNIVLHWYSGSIQTLEKALNNGYYFSINPSMVKTKKGQEIIKRIPIERLLTETDGPFVKVNGNEVSPLDIEIIINEISSIHKIDPQETKRKVEANFLRINSIK